METSVLSRLLVGTLSSYILIPSDPPFSKMSGDEREQVINNHVKIMQSALSEFGKKS